MMCLHRLVEAQTCDLRKVRSEDSIVVRISTGLIHLPEESGDIVCPLNRSPTLEGLVCRPPDVRDLVGALDEPGHPPPNRGEKHRTPAHEHNTTTPAAPAL